MASFFNNNFEIIIFFYGSTLVMLGFAIFAQLRQSEQSGFRLLSILWLLAMFGYTHGAHELIDMFDLFEKTSPPIDFISTGLAVVSFIFIFIFSFKLINLSEKVRIGLWLPTILAVLFVAMPVALGPTSLSLWSISSRYFLGFPANVLIAIGLPLYYVSALQGQNLEQTKKYFYLGAFFFGAYAVTAGVVVPEASFFPASVVNDNSFFEQTGIPARVFRGLAALGIVWTTWNILDIFNVEQAARRQRTEAALRKRDSDIRQAYTDVFSAVTQDKLVLLGEDEIDGLLGQPASESRTVDSYKQLSEIRTFIRESLDKLVDGNELIDQAIYASGEALANGIKHAGSCTVGIFQKEHQIQVRVADKGPGINFRDLPKAALVSGYSTKHSLGLGFSIILEICDRILLSTGSNGTILVLELQSTE